MKKILLIFLVASGLCATADPARLNFQLLPNVEETPIVQWRLLSLSAPDASGRSGGSVSVACYSGPAYQLSAEGLETNAMLIEASTNMIDWQPFPARGFQLTFYPTSVPFLNIPEDQILFFRGLLTTNQP